MAERYYPHVPWDDDPIHGDSIEHDTYIPEWLDYDNVRGVQLGREGIYGPLAYIFKYLCARDNKQLIADVRIIGVLETA